MSINEPQSKLNLEEFQELHQKYRDRLHASLTGFVRDTNEAEDITAWAFETAWAKRDSFRGDASPYTYLYAIAMNEARRRHRRKKTAVSFQLLDGIVEDRLYEPDRTVEEAEKSDLRARLRQAIERMPAKYRTVLVDHFIHDQSVQRIAKREGIPVGTVCSRIFTAKRLLRKRWKAT